jgi:hypothetical protein
MSTPNPVPAALVNPTLVSGEPPAELLAAVDASLADTGDPGVVHAPGPDVTADPPSHGQDPSDTPPDPTGAPASTTPPGEPAVPPDSKPAVPEADKPKDPAVTDPANPPKPGEAKPDAKPSDEFGELPKDVKQETRERFEAIKVKFDAVSERASRAESIATRWHETIQSTGATPEQFNKVLGALKDANSGTPEGLMRYYQALQEEIKPLAKLLGVEAPGVDPLDEFPELKARVADEDDGLTRADALLLARAQKREALQTVHATTTASTEAQQQAFNYGINAVAQLGASLKAANPSVFAAKFPIMQPIIDNVIATLPPDKWVAAITKTYNELPTPAAVAAPHTPTPVVPPSIRPGASGTGGFNKEPGSALEAMDMALGLGGG